MPTGPAALPGHRLLFSAEPRPRPFSAWPGRPGVQPVTAKPKTYRHPFYFTATHLWTLVVAFPGRQPGWQGLGEPQPGLSGSPGARAFPPGPGPELQPPKRVALFWSLFIVPCVASSVRSAAPSPTWLAQPHTGSGGGGRSGAGVWCLLAALGRGGVSGASLPSD